jgi:hypothetical protein
LKCLLNIFHANAHALRNGLKNLVIYHTTPQAQISAVGVKAFLSLFIKKPDRLLGKGGGIEPVGTFYYRANYDLDFIAFWNLLYPDLNLEVVTWFFIKQSS